MSKFPAIAKAKAKIIAIRENRTKALAEFSAMMIAKASTAAKAKAKAAFIHPAKASTAKALVTFECLNAFNRVLIPAESAKAARRIAENHSTYGHFFRTLKSTVRRLR